MTKGKLIGLIVFAVLSGLACWYFRNIYGWMEFRKNTDTPRVYLSHFVTEKDNYSKDSIEILQKLKLLLLKRQDFFHNSAYYDSTQLVVDTILYNMNFDKIAVFVITQNPTSRQLAPDKESDWYYDATCYLGVRRNDSITLSWIGPVFTNSSNRQDISKTIRDACFRRFAAPKDTTGAYTYNLNDFRFWSSTIWKKIEEEKIMRKNFQEKKKNHPENVYEPAK